MIKILLFSRNDLVNLYGEISNQLSSEYEFVHLAYSDKEERILKEKYHIKKVINFKNEIKSIYESEQIDLSLQLQIDKEIIEQTGGKFCLNSAIQSDRTYAYMRYEDCLLMSQVYYKFWDKFIENEKFKIMLHEPVALFFLQIASVLSKKNDIFYLTQINVFGENKHNWIFVSAENGFPVEMPFHLKNKTLSVTERNRSKKFLNKFRVDYNLIFPTLATQKLEKSKLRFIKTSSILVLKSIIRKNKNQFRNIDSSCLNHIENYSYFHKPTTIDRIKINYDEFFQFHYDDFDIDKEYFYYPMHMEPEAVVLYWGDGIYKNQIKLIENISAQLPPNNFLYVKVHPIVKEERHIIDYRRLKSIPNLKLLGPDIPGKIIISKAKGVMTINGTSGLEAVLLNKPVFVFGNSFYDLSNRVIKISNIRDLQEKVYKYYDTKFEDDEDLLKFVTGYLKTGKQGFVSYYLDYMERMGIDHKDNCKIISEAIKVSINFILN